MSFQLIDDLQSSQRLGEELVSVNRIGLDCEAAGFHRYSDRLCLVQLSTDRDTYVIDSLSVDPTPLLTQALTDPAVTVVMHGADFDIRLIHRDLGLRVHGLVDTQVAAALLGEPALGLAPLLESYLDVGLSKKYQRADWAKRPLPEEMLRYAAADTSHLLPLWDVLLERLAAMGRVAWAKEEFRALEEVRFEEDESDPVARVKGARDLDLVELAALREALEWRDIIAREKDRAPFRVAGDRTLLAAARKRPGSVAELAELRGMNPSLARSRGPDLLARFRRVEALENGELQPYPRRAGNGRSRPPPEVEERLDRLKERRNARAEDLGMDRGTLVSNAVLAEIAWAAPDDREELRGVPGVKAWQVEAMGDALLDRGPTVG
jgi:ribonuclease D